MTKIKDFFKDKHNIALILVLLFALIIRMYFFFNTLDQPLWWDESQYAEQAKKLGQNLETNDIWYYRRTMLLSIFWSFFYKIGLGETALRFTELLFSLLLVYSTFLIGKEMFNKKVGLFAAFGVSVSSVIIFETSRLLTSVPSTSMMMLAIYFFYKGYLKNYNVKQIYLFGLFAALSLNIRFAAFLSIFSFGIIYLIKEKGKFWKQKQLIASFLLILVLLAPFFYLYSKNYPLGIRDFVKHYSVSVPEEDALLLGNKGLFIYLKALPDNLSLLLFLAFIFGVFLLLDFVLAPDYLFKDTNLQRNLFLFLFIIPPFFYHSTKSLYLEERYLIGILPVIFIIAGYGLYKVYTYTQSHNKYIVLSLVLIFLIVVAGLQITKASKIINDRKDSYQQVKEAALWMKSNSNPGNTIISNSIPQNQYYSGLSTYYLEDEKEIQKLKPKYYVVSIYERSAQVFLEYPEKNPDKLKLVKAYFIDKEKTQPTLLIYEFLN
ncbi:MAG: glycosyltransferase family 39 protein [Nanoarchaeota archaeon]